MEYSVIMQILDPSGYPMMGKHEVKIIDDLIEQHKPKLCLEWGSGNSTIYFPKKHECITKWIAMEHKRVYLQLLGDKIKKEVAEIIVEEGKDKYIEYPYSYTVKNNEKFDFVFVDGAWRDECMDKAFSVAKKDAIILLHDAGRIESASIMARWRNIATILCEGEKMLRNGYYAHRGLALFINN